MSQSTSTEAQHNRQLFPTVAAFVNELKAAMEKAAPGTGTVYVWYAEENGNKIDRRANQPKAKPTAKPVVRPSNKNLISQYRNVRG